MARAGASGDPRRATAQRPPVRVGLVSDTHGLLRPQAVDFLRGSDYIVHGGDIGGAHVLEQLAALAPVTAVRGNNDDAAWAAGLPETAVLRVQSVDVFVVHEIDRLEPGPAVVGPRVVVSGHSHQARVECRDQVWYVNPGSAGPRRFRLPVTVGELLIHNGSVHARIVELDVGPTRARPEVP
jgi:uncharacterized protein